MIATFALVRVCESQLDRDPDWRYRRPGAISQVGSGDAWDLKAMFVGTLANFMSACIAGMLL